MGDKAEKKRYNYMENTLQKINTKLSLPQGETKRNNEILRGIVDVLITKIKDTSATFKCLYREIFFGGSYYDGLKIDRPEEYDLDMVLTFPKGSAPVLAPVIEHPGYMSLKFKPDEVNGDFRQWLNGDSCLSTTKVQQWMEGVMTKTLKEFPEEGSQNVLYYKENKIFIKIHKNGPAFKMAVNGEVNGERMKFDVDLVLCFLCEGKLWPAEPFRKNTTNKPNFLVVPKAPATETATTSKCWRLSFQEQERQLIAGKAVLKPSIKLLKYLRDKLKFKMFSSYSIKTTFLWELESREKTFWTENTLSYVFIEMLQKYTDCIMKKEIKYFWNEQNNLLDGVDDIVLVNNGNRLQKILTDIKTAQDPLCIAKYYMTSEELDVLKAESTELIVAGQNNTQIRANIGSVNLKMADEEFVSVHRKLDEIRAENRALVEEVAGLKAGNLRLAGLMENMCDKLEVLNAKFGQLEQQYRLMGVGPRPKNNVALENNVALDELLGKDCLETSLRQMNLN